MLTPFYIQCCTNCLHCRSIKISFLILSLINYNQSFAQVQNNEPESDGIQLEELDIINSEYRETNLSITPNGELLYFMSDRGGQPWSVKSGKYKRKTHFDGDIWYCSKIKGKWQAPICLDSTINTCSGEDEPLISPDGQIVVFQSWKDDWKQTGGPYYVAELSGDKWSNTVGLGGGINKFFIGKFNRSAIGYATDGAAISPDGNLFIVACGEDYDGSMDLYMSKKVNGRWGEMRKAKISTAGDERSVYIAGDGITFYFASDGYDGMGGLDIYKTTYEEGRFGPIQNIGKPFNSKEDEYGFIMDARGESAYFSREGNVYQASLGDEQKNLRPFPVLLISGMLKDAKGNPIEDHLDLIDVGKKKVVATSKSNALTGKYLFETPLKATSYQIKSNSRALVDTTFKVIDSGKFQELNIDLIAEESDKEKKKFEKEEVVVVEARFEFDQVYISDLDKLQLSKILERIKSTNDYQIEIIGHTDNKGSKDYNFQLGLKRAKEVMNYLVAYGANPRKINIESKGEKLPIDSNQTEEGRSKNRRAEVRLKYNQ